MRRHLRRTTKQYIIVVTISLIVVGAAFIIAYITIIKKMERSYGVKLSNISTKIEINKKQVYEAIREIEAGEYLEAEMLLHHEVVTEQENSTFIEQKDLGKLALIKIPKGTYVQKSMVTNGNMEDKVREYECSCVRINPKIKAQDCVDVRIFFPNGEDYILLSKKVVKGLSEDCIYSYFWLSEEEILLMSSAIVDAYLYQGAYLYTTKYIEPLVQEASIVTYQPGLATLSLIEHNPNIVEEAKSGLRQSKRKAMENRLADSMHVSVDEVQWELSPNTIYPKPLVQEEKENSNNASKKQLANQETDNFIPVIPNETKDMPKTYIYYQQEKDAKEEDIEYGE